MIAIICVYNNPKLLQDNLLNGLVNQTVPYQFIGIPNINNMLFYKITSALNYGGQFATGNYLAFIHQDIYLPNPDWLAQTERILDKIDDLGIAGVAGITQSGERLGHLMHRDFHWGTKLESPVQVQCLDECVLIVKNEVFRKIQFDENLTFHFYGHDYSLAVAELGLKAYSIEAFVHHNTPCTNIKDKRFLQEKEYLFTKWKDKVGGIKTIC